MDEEVFNTTVLAKKRQSKEEFFQMEGAENSELQASTRMLPPNLYIQLDNSAKDNKNWAMMAFCSELVARRCCKMITMSFLVVGHTHEDVDAFFSKVNAAQAGKDIESLPHFLTVVYHAQSSKAYPRVIQEVADYKEHVKDYMEKITGQSAPVAIRFYMRDNIPVYQVQEKYGGEWVPSYGRTVWKRCEPESETNFQVVLPPRQDPVAKGLMYITNGLMLLIRPSDDFECQDCLWVGKATGAVCQVGADTNFNKIPIQWWRPKHASSKASISDRYSQCIQRNVAWEVDPAYSGSHWIMADACVYAWKSRATKDKVSLPKTVQEIALSVLDRMSPGSEGAIVLVDS
ncbi:hypothetical protein R1sor_025215 [Riccia sorocarpa]|uniref:DUF7869 domain-containing protein n=1 Tax=Riccia sorocarpa TaxID=122646 RepID=A0ABD3G9H8_9MARC